MRERAPEPWRGKQASTQPRSQKDRKRERKGLNLSTLANRPPTSLAIPPFNLFEHKPLLKKRHLVIMVVSSPKHTESVSVLTPKFSPQKCTIFG